MSPVPADREPHERGLAAIASRGPALAVVAHPDDESFGLGAVLAALASAGVASRVVCLTQGEASTLGPAGGLGGRRRAELVAAAEELGLGGVVLHDFPDGALDRVDPTLLDDAVEAALGEARLLVVFEPSGVTGNRDHRAATASAHRVARKHGLEVLEWGVPPDVAAQLNRELATSFRGIGGPGAIDLEVDRERQLAAIERHGSQAVDNRVLWRRLELQGGRERVQFAGHRG